VTDNRALDTLLAERDDLSVVLDVWEGEPAINMSLLQHVDLGTPHIAGYSLDGKLRGTEMIYRSACDWFGLPGWWRAADLLPAGSVIECNEPGDAAVRAAVFSTYDIRADDARLRTMLSLPASEQPAFFDQLRKDYPVRREFSATSVIVDDADSECEPVLRGLGFPVVVSA
jgi:erythronate-4-phosphate dehydrogenase